MLSITIKFCIVQPLNHFADCHYAKCHYVECHFVCANAKCNYVKCWLQHYMISILILLNVVFIIMQLPNAEYHCANVGIKSGA